MSGSPAAQPGVPAGLVAGPVQGRRGPVHQHCLLPALLPVGLLHLDGPGGPAHVPGHRQGVQQLHDALHAQVLPHGLG